MNKTFEKLQPYLDKAMAFQTARNLFEWDDQTQAPFEAADYTSKVVGILADEYMKCLVNDDVKNWLKASGAKGTRGTYPKRKGHNKGT